MTAPQYVHHYEVDLVDAGYNVVSSQHFEPDELDGAIAYSREHANGEPASSPTTVYADKHGNEGSESHGLIEGLDYRVMPGARKD